MCDQMSHNETGTYKVIRVVRLWSRKEGLLHWYS